MLQYLKQESNKTFTENGAATLKTTESDCLDLLQPSVQFAAKATRKSPLVLCVLLQKIRILP